METDPQKIRLEKEKALGEQYSRIYENYVKPFVDAKQESLFEAFKACPSDDKDKLVLIRLQVNAVEALDVEFQHYITTGKLAEKTLNDMENENGSE